MERGALEVVESNSRHSSNPDEVEISQLVALGRAISDPIRVRMLGMLAAAANEGRGCCDLPDLGVPVKDEDDSLGICVCEFMDYYGMAQSKVSYHLGKLKEAGLVQEKKRGSWSFYSLNQRAARSLICAAAEHLGVRLALINAWDG